MSPDWNILPEPVQRAVADAALRRAVAVVADHAEALARELDCGTIADRGGAEALRLLVAILIQAGQDTLILAGI